MAQFDSAQVRDYYDRHTAVFVSFGQGGHLGAIHRAVWGPGTGSQESALLHRGSDRRAPGPVWPNGMGRSVHM